MYDFEQFREAVRMIRTTLHLRMREHIRMERQKQEQLAMRLGYLSPQAVLNSKKQYLADLEEKLVQRMDYRLQRDKHRIQLLAGRLESGSPVKKLSQGFSYVTDGEGRPVRKSSQVQPGDEIYVRTLEGRIHAEVLGVE